VLVAVAVVAELLAGGHQVELLHQVEPAVIELQPPAYTWCWW